MRGGGRGDPSTTVWIGTLVFRWAALLWMIALALTVSEPYVRPEIAWAAIGAAFAWTAWVTTSRGRLDGVMLWFDLVVAVALLLLSAVVVPRGTIEERQLFATAYPISAALAWGAARGPLTGLGAGLVLGAAYALTRPLNGTPFDGLSAEQVQMIANGAVNFLLAAGAVGVVVRMLERSSADVRAATEEAIGAHERAARLAEREAMGRTIHDSVLQSLAMIHKRGRELSRRDAVPGRDVAELADIAAREERELRSLILREPAEPRAERTSLRERLERLGREVDGVPVVVSAVGPLWMPIRAAEELSAAVRQALANVSEHADASHATVYAEEQSGWLVVSIRDDGRGFDYDESRLRAGGKAGILKSIKGRIEDLGGTLRIESRRGRGTEVELRVPVVNAAGDE